MTDEEIEAIADENRSYVTEVSIHKGTDCGIRNVNTLDEIAFARAIEAKVREEYAPKFKVGEKVLCDSSTYTIIDIERQPARYEMDDEWGWFNEDELEAIEESS